MRRICFLTPIGYAKAYFNPLYLLNLSGFVSLDGDLNLQNLEMLSLST